MDESDLNKMIDLATKQARRSNLKRFRTGAVVFNSQGEILGRGCSHIGKGERCTHAEQHALMSLRSQNLSNKLYCVVVTLTKGGNWATTSRPCALCTHILNKYEVTEVIYPEKANDGSWILNKEDVSSLAARSHGNIHEKYAKQMSIVA